VLPESKIKVVTSLKFNTNVGGNQISEKKRETETETETVKKLPSKCLDIQ
jgi:hypothetical protein